MRKGFSSWGQAPRAGERAAAAAPHGPSASDLARAEAAARAGRLFGALADKIAAETWRHHADTAWCRRMEGINDAAHLRDASAEEIRAHCAAARAAAEGDPDLLPFQGLEVAARAAEKLARGEIAAAGPIARELRAAADSAAAIERAADAAFAAARAAFSAAHPQPPEGDSLRPPPPAVFGDVDGALLDECAWGRWTAQAFWDGETEDDLGAGGATMAGGWSSQGFRPRWTWSPLGEARRAEMDAAVQAWCSAQHAAAEAAARAAGSAGCWRW